MQFSVITILAVMASVAVASPGSRGSPLHARLQPRQASTVPVGTAAMTDANGNVILFDSKNVFKDAVAKGQ